MTMASLRLDSSPLTSPLQQRAFKTQPPLCSFLRRSSVVVCSAKPAASLSVASESAASQQLSRIGSLSQVSGVLGSQWGDEGKGKLVDILAHHFDIVAHCQIKLMDTEANLITMLRNDRLPQLRSALVTSTELEMMI